MYSFVLNIFSKYNIKGKQDAENEDAKKSGQDNKGENTNEDVQDAVSLDSDILGPDKIREDTNETGKVTGFGNADTAGNDSGGEDSDEVSESGGTDDTDIAVQITYFFSPNCTFVLLNLNVSGYQKRKKRRANIGQQ